MCQNYDICSTLYTRLRMCAKLEILYQIARENTTFKHNSILYTARPAKNKHAFILHI